MCRFIEAEDASRRAKGILDAIRELLDRPTRGLLLPRAAVVLGRCLRELGRYEEAGGLLLEAISEAEQCFGKDGLEVAEYLNEYGILCKFVDRYDEGERYYLRALEILENAWGGKSAETASLYHNLAGLEHARRNFSKGEPLARLAYEIRRRALGDDHPDAVADAVAWAGLLDGLGRFEESVPIYREGLKFYEGRLGSCHFEVAATLNNLGMAFAAQGDTQQGLLALKRALSLKRKLFASDHPEIRLIESNVTSLESDAACSSVGSICHAGTIS